MEQMASVGLRRKGGECGEWMADGGRVGHFGGGREQQVLDLSLAFAEKSLER